MTRPALLLQRLQAGQYRTRDGRYEILLHPHSKNGPSPEWPHNEWLVYDTDPTAGYDGSPIHDDTLYTLREARALLADHIANPPAPEPEPQPTVRPAGQLWP